MLAVLAGALCAAGWLRCEGGKPELVGPERLFVGRGKTQVAIEARDAESGIRRLELRVVQGPTKQRIAQVARPGNLGLGGARGAVEQIEGEIEAEALGLREGEAKLVAKAVDWSWRRWLKGNPEWLEIPVRVDLTRPRVEIETGQTYVRRGGAGAVVYRVREETQRDGVQVGDAFFPGRPFPGDPKLRIALFAIPRDVAPSPRIAVLAVDLAGNESAASWPVALTERSFDDVRIELGKSQGSLETMSLAQLEWRRGSCTH